MPTTLSERKLLFIIGSVQFVNVLDFMMVMPLGPDFAQALGIPNSSLGLVGAAYTAAAALAGIAGALVLDKFDRRKALGVALAGLVLGTAAGGLAIDLRTMLAARLLAGAFGGPATSLALAIVTDVVPPERRGRAMGVVMGAFSAASVLGVPLGLELARIGGWRMPFFGVAGLGLILIVGAMLLLPPLRGHLERRSARRVDTGELLRRPTVILALSMMAMLMVANFALIPNLAAYWQFNFGYPREKLGLLYLVGGTVSFVTMRIAGKLTDRFGSTFVAAMGTALYVTILFVSFIYPMYQLPVLALFVGFMTTASFRFVPIQALCTRVPRPEERARFMSAQSAVQHMSAAAGALIAAKMLRELPGGKLEGMDRVGWFAVVLASLAPVLLWLVELRVHRGERRDQAASPEGLGQRS